MILSINLSTIVPIIGVPILRNVLGWFENSLADGKISNYEWAQLGETIVRVGVIGLATYLGLNGMGMDVSALGASAGAVVLDLILSKVSKIGTK